LSQRHQQVVRQAVQEHAKAIRHVAMIAQPIGAQLALQFLVAILALAALGVGFIGSLRARACSGTVGQDGPAVGALRIRFTLDDHPPRLGPRAGLILKTGEQPLRLAGGFVAFDRLLQQFVAVSPQHGVHAEADRVFHSQPLARFIQPRPRVAGIGAEANQHLGELFPQDPRDALQLHVHRHGGIGRAVQQRRQHHPIVFGTRDGADQILVLFVVAVEQRELLIAVGRIVEHIRIEGHLSRRLVKRLDEPREKPLLQPQQRPGGNGVLEPRQRRLARQLVRVGQTVGQQFEDGVAAERIVIVLVFVAGDDAEHTRADHLQQRVPGITPRFVQLLRETGCEPSLLIELSKDQQPRIGGQHLLDRLHTNGLMREKIEVQLPNIV